MDVESTFRVMFGVKKEQDMVELIEAAVSVASLIAPHKLKKHRSRIVKLLFDEDPYDDDDDELLKVTSTPKKTSHSPEIKKLGFGKKSVEESQVVAPQMPPLKMHCVDGRSKASGHVGQRTATFKTELKVRPNGKPKPKSRY
nr:myb-like protein V [Ipomoea batatas]